MSVDLPEGAAALVVVDAQKAFDLRVAAGDRRNNPQAESRIADLLVAFRSASRPVFHVRHANHARESLFNPSGEGFAPLADAQEIDGEPVVVKTVNSAFIGTDLQERLDRAAISTVVIVGATTNHCVETSTRMAGNLGYDTYLVQDAVWAFDRVGPDGTIHTAEHIHTMSLANLGEEFCTVVETADVLAGL